jgi:hypothetical protein
MLVLGGLAPWACEGVGPCQEGIGVELQVVTWHRQEAAAAAAAALPFLSEMLFLSSCEQRPLGVYCCLAAVLVGESCWHRMILCSGWGIGHPAGSLAMVQGPAGVFL